MPSPQQALEAFADPGQNPDLMRLEGLLSRFNLFEAMGVLRQELRHSDLLASFLDPRQHHGLKTVFLKELLQAVLATVDDEGEVAQSDLDLWDLSQAIVYRESHRIDILVLDEVNRFAVIIENKIDSGERTGQLIRYYNDVHSQYPNYKIIALYLTRDGNAPTSDLYHAVSYTQVCQITEKIVDDYRSALNNDIVVLMEHYAQMLRRHIMSDSGVADLCRSIYQQHKQALDLIFEHRPDQQEHINDYAYRLIMNEPSIKPCYRQKSYIQFNPIAWNGSAWYQNVHRDCPWFLYFQFNSEPDALLIALLMTPGDQSHREELFEVAHKASFQGCPPSLTRLRGAGGWSRLFEKAVLTAADYDKPQEEIEAIICKAWEEFLHEDLQTITQAIRGVKWLWETTPLPPVEQLQVGQFVRSLITSSGHYKLYNFAKGWINFTLQDWHKSLKFRDIRENDTNYAVFPYLTFGNQRDRLTVGMWIGPGEQAEREIVRRKVQEHGVNGVVSSLNQNQWSKISSFEILNPGDYHKSWEEIEPLILDKWKEFVDTEIPKMMQAVRNEKWLWEMPPGE